MGNPMPFEKGNGPNRHNMENYGDLQSIARGMKLTSWVPGENISFGHLSYTDFDSRSSLELVFLFKTSDH